MFNQSFDSKLSEFSNNSGILVLNKPQGIDEYDSSRKQKYNSLEKQLGAGKKKLDLVDLEDADEYLDHLERAGQKRDEGLKNFTFSKNQGHSSPEKKDAGMGRKKQAKRSKFVLENPKKIVLSLESPKNQDHTDIIAKKPNKQKAEKQKPFELALPGVKKPQKFTLDLNLVEETQPQANHAEPPKPPSLGKHKKFNMAGSSFYNQNFSSGTGQQHRLNAPRNNSKKTFSFNADIVNRGLRDNFKLPRNKFQPALEIVIPEENSRDMEQDLSEEPSLELPSLKERQEKQSCRGKKKFDLAIEVPSEKVVLVDEFQDSMSGSGKEGSRGRGPSGLNIGNDRTSSNSPRHVSGIQKSIKIDFNQPPQWRLEQPTKNLEIPLDTELINRTMGNRGGGHVDLFGACRTNPLPTTKNANLKNRCFEFGGARKKRHLTVSLTGDEIFSKGRQGTRNQKKEGCIDEVSNEEILSQSSKEQKKRNLKMKINLKNSDQTQKNFSKQSSQIINSIQSKCLTEVNSQDNNFMISPKCGDSGGAEVGEFEIGPKFRSIKMSNGSQSSNGDGMNFENFSKQHSQGVASRQSLKAQKLVISSDQNIQVGPRIPNLSNRVIKINPLSPDKKKQLRTVSGNASVKNSQQRHIDLDLITNAKEKKRHTDTKKVSKKTSIVSYNMSSLLSSGINQNMSTHPQAVQGEESEEVARLRDQLKKNERRVQRIVQGTGF